jgi:hypothetical protein
MRKVVYVAIAVTTVLGGCKKNGSPTEPAGGPAAPKPAPKVEKPDEDPGFTRLKKPSTTLAEAIDIVREDVDQKSIGTHNFASRRLAFWAVGDGGDKGSALKWDAVAVTKNETNPRLIIKDPEASLGKRLCVKGFIAEIHKHKIEERKMFRGLLGTWGGDILSFWAIGDTGDLVEERTAKFCGVAAGKYVYRSREGKEKDAIEVVGFFDLPTNKPTPPQPGPEVAATAK